MPLGRRPLTYDEVQALFDAAVSRVGESRSRHRKGALAALRDATAITDDQEAVRVART